MASKGFIITGIKEIDQAFRQFEKEMKKVLRKNMREGMKDLCNQIKTDFPKDTGETAAGIKVRAGKGKRGEIVIDVRSADDNWKTKWIEFGTETKDGEVRIEAQAPFRKGYDQHGDQAKKITIDGATKGAVELINKMSKEGK